MQNYNPAAREIEEIVSRGPRERTRVKWDVWDDGLTEEQWLEAIGNDDVRNETDKRGITAKHQAILDPNTQVSKDRVAARDRQSLEKAKGVEIDHSDLDAQGLDPPSIIRTKDQATARRRCHSCNRGETPRWRRGPDGPRTLCNACGLRV